MMLDKETKIYLNGKITTLEESKISLLTHALHYGSSAFEGIRAYETQNGPAIFRLKEHIERLFYSAKSLYMELDYSVEEIMNACVKVIRENNLKSAYIRPIVYYGDDSMGLDPTKCKANVAIIAWEWGKYLSDNIKVKISSIKRISEHSTAVDAKIGGHYINSIHANLEAKKLGFDEALLLDHDGNVAEGPGENLFLIKDKTIYTPKTGKILKGITRDTILKISSDLGYEVIERKITPFELDSFEAAFFCGTAAEITTIKQINKIEYNTQIGLDIKEKYFEIVKGKDKKYDNFLTYC